MISNNNHSIAFSSLRALGNNVRQELRRFNSDEHGAGDVMNQVLIVAVAVIALSFIAKTMFPSVFDNVQKQITTLFDIHL